MNGYLNSRGILLPRVHARTLSLAVLSALTLAACGGGGGGGSSGGSNNPPANQAPTANAGTDKTAAFPEPVPLTGTASDPENGTLTYTWTQTAGPGTTTFSAASALTTDATFSAPGDYTLRLSVSDGTNTTTDDVVVSIPALYPSGSDSTGWTTASPASVGLTESKLDEAIAYATSAPRTLPSTGQSDNGGSGMVIRYGKLVRTWGALDQPYEMKSTTKSIGGIALLLALDTPSLNLTLTSPARSQRLDIFGERPNTNTVADRNAITVGQLATHTAGFEKTDDPFVAGGGTDGGSDDDGAIQFPPGTNWNYSDAGLNWLADVLTVTFDKDLRDLLRESVFSKLGISNTSLTWRPNHSRSLNITDPVTNVTAARRELSSGIDANVDAMARIGLLFLRKGKWGADQLISTSSVDLVQTPQSFATGLTNPNSATFPNAPAHYGVLWWTNNDGAIPNLPADAYWSWGLGESLIVVIPTLDLVVVRAGSPDQDGSHTPRSWNFGWNGDYSVLAPFLTPIGQAAGQ